MTTQCKYRTKKQQSEEKILLEENHGLLLNFKANTTKRPTGEIEKKNKNENPARNARQKQWLVHTLWAARSENGLPIKCVRFSRFESSRGKIVTVTERTCKNTVKDTTLKALYCHPSS